MLSDTENLSILVSGHLHALLQHFGLHFQLLLFI